MNHQLCVLLYSKYSSLSKQLLGALETSPIDLTAAVGLKSVCIDNEDIREQICRFNKVEVTSVPCVLIIYGSGGVEKYEGNKAFQWIDEIVQKHAPKPIPRPTPQPTPQPLISYSEPPKRRRKARRPPKYTEDSSSDEFDEESEEEYIPPKRTKKSKRTARKPKRTRKKKVAAQRSSPEHAVESGATSIGSLLSSSDEEIHENFKRPPVSIRTGASSYDLTSEFGEQQEPNRDMSSRMRSSTAATKKSGDLMSAALAMQKDRESMASQRPVGGPPSQRP